MTIFQDLSLSDLILKAISNMGFEEATPIQEQAIPAAMEGRDVIGQAQTGTGKTAAFGIPMLENIDPRSEVIQGIVITPTREHAAHLWRPGH
jgi:ATP-dependent RNA helicase DeaD